MFECVTNQQFLALSLIKAGNCPRDDTLQILDFNMHLEWKTVTAKTLCCVINVEIASLCMHTIPTSLLPSRHLKRSRITGVTDISCLEGSLSALRSRNASQSLKCHTKDSPYVPAFLLCRHNSISIQWQRENTSSIEFVMNLLVHVVIPLLRQCWWITLMIEVKACVKIQSTEWRMKWGLPWH